MTDEPMHLGDARGQWYYCFRHEKVETRDEFRQMDRMGPYPTREDAENWQERVAARNEAWEDERSSQGMIDPVPSVAVRYVIGPTRCGVRDHTNTGAKQRRSGVLERINTAVFVVQVREDLESVRVHAVTMILKVNAA